MKNKITLTLLALMLATSFSFSQKKGKIGLSGSIQDNQFGILLPMWLDDKFVMAPAFDFKFAEKVATEFTIGVASRFYLKTEKLAPYWGLKFGVIVNNPSSKNEIDDETKTDITGGIAFGVEYFLDDNFSFGVEAQGNFTKSDKNSNRFGNPDGFNFNTATMISATIYF